MHTYPLHCEWPFKGEGANRPQEDSILKAHLVRVKFLHCWDREECPLTALATLVCCTHVLGAFR